MSVTRNEPPRPSEINTFGSEGLKTVSKKSKFSYPSSNMSRGGPSSQRRTPESVMQNTDSIQVDLIPEDKEQQLVRNLSYENPYKTDNRHIQQNFSKSNRYSELPNKGFSRILGKIKEQGESEDKSPTQHKDPNVMFRNLNPLSNTLTHQTFEMNPNVVCYDKSNSQMTVKKLTRGIGGIKKQNLLSLKDQKIINQNVAKVVINNNNNFYINNKTDIVTEALPNELLQKKKEGPQREAAKAEPEVQPKRGFLGKREELEKSQPKEYFKILSYTSGSPDFNFGKRDSRRKRSSKFNDFFEESKQMSVDNRSITRSFKRIGIGSIREINTLGEKMHYRESEMKRVKQVSSFDQKQRYMSPGDFSVTKTVPKRKLGLKDLNMSIEQLKKDFTAPSPIGMFANSGTKRPSTGNNANFTDSPSNPNLGVSVGGNDTLKKLQKLTDQIKNSKNSGNPKVTFFRYESMINDELDKTQ